MGTRVKSQSKGDGRRRNMRKKNVPNNRRWRGNPYDNAKAESFMKTLKDVVKFYHPLTAMAGSLRRRALLYRTGQNVRRSFAPRLI